MKTQMKTIVTLAASVLLSVSVFANTGKEGHNETAAEVKTVQLTGSVTDNKNNEALAGATLIIDAKFYSHTTQMQYNIHTLHSNNLYQIFTYVKNKTDNFS
jgi:hypothetical protein